MVRLKLVLGVVSVALISSAAMAFQEQQSASPQPTEGAAVVAPLAPDAPAAARGTPVRIPGLGTLGVIPKMDFGLELLYGAAEQSKRTDPGKPEADDVLVGGRIKHKF